MKRIRINRLLAMLLIMVMSFAMLPTSISAEAATDMGLTEKNFKISVQTEKIQLGDTVMLSVEASEGVDIKSLEWSSSNLKVASVESNGAVTGMSVGTATITVNSKEGMRSTCAVTVIDEPYFVKVYVPKGVTGEKGLSFYPTTGFDLDNRDTFNSKSVITSYTKDTKTDDKYNIYTMTLKRGTYSFRATDSKGKSLGGGTFRLPAEGAGARYQSNDNTEIYLRLVEAYITNEEGGAKATAEDYKVTLMNKIGVVTMGSPYINASGYECYPVLTYVNGNGLLYYTLFTPSKIYASEHNVGLSIWKNYAIREGADSTSLSVKLKDMSTFTINTPKNAKAALYTQVLNYNAERIDSVRTVPLNDGTMDHVFNISRSSDITYRISMEGMRTKAGFVNNVSGDILKVSFDPLQSPKELDTSGGKAYGESSLLLNINERNKLDLKVGEQYKVRAYRAAWQIVQTITDNIMIEPDFHYNIISGEDVISIDTIDGGNAGGNWAWVTAKNEGTAIVEVSYDALNVNDDGQNRSIVKPEGFHGATDPLRTGVFIVTVGDKYSDISGVNWDSEYNTCYFSGDAGVITIEPEGNKVSVNTASLTNGKMSQWQQITVSNGHFDVPIVPGNNIMRIESDGLIDYYVVRGAKLTAIIDNNIEGRDEIYPGDTVSVKLKGLYMPIPKFAGIYNPGFPNTSNVSYEFEGERYSSKGTQYNIIEPDANQIQIEIPKTATDYITLTSGKISLTSMGSHYGAHRVLTDVGVPANFNAASLKMKDILLPDLTIKISQPTETSSVTKAEQIDISDMVGADKTHINSFYSVEGLKFDLSENERDGYVLVSFEDYGVRLDDADFKTPLGVIVSPTQVPYKTGDNIAVVTLRLLDALGIEYSNTGSLDNAFYLASIKNFKLSDGTLIDSFGEFDSGAGSGWMITHNNWYVNSSTADFKVEDGDFIRWQNTCQVGADIGCDWENHSAEITGLYFYKNFGELSPAFENGVTEYTYTVPPSVTDISLEALQKNYWAILTYTSNGKTYKPRASIPVEDGTIIELDCAFAEYAGEAPTDTDNVKIKIKLSDVDALPNAEISREKFARLLERKIFGRDVYTAESPMVRVMEFGISDGRDGKSNIYREQLVTMLYRYAIGRGMDVSNRIDLRNHADIENLSLWASDAMSWALAEGIIGKQVQYMIMPKVGVSTGQADNILQRFVDLY